MADEWKSLDMTEFKAFIGLLLLGGAYKSNSERTSILWHEIHGRPFFRATMSRNRFKQILCYLRIDECWIRRQNKNKANQN